MWLGDDECDFACFNELCGYDKGDCKECSPGCTPNRIGNGICDGDCMTDKCFWDMGDCAGVCKVYPVEYNKAPFEYNQCRNEWAGDGFCDCFCLNDECGNDKGDCAGKEAECESKTPKKLAAFEFVSVKISEALKSTGSVFPKSEPRAAVTQ